MRKVVRRIAPWALPGLLACGTPPDAPDELDEAAEAAFLDGDVVLDSAIRDGAPEARAVLRLANVADAAQLGAVVGLGPRAVAGILAARSGSDATDGTADDTPLRTLATLDAVPHVGYRSWSRLIAQADATGLVARLDPCGRGPAVEGTLPLPQDIRTAAPDLARVYATDRLEVWARTTRRPSDADLEQFRARSCAAYGFDLDLTGREPDEAPLAAPVRVVVLDVPTYNKATEAPGTYGVTFPGTDTTTDAFVMPSNALSNPDDLDDTLAHELLHVLQFRYAPNDLEIPWYLVEGAAVQAGAAHAVARHGRTTGFWVGWVQSAVGADATLTFDRYGPEDQTQNLSEVGHDQSIGGFFVEYLRVHHPIDAGARGIPDVQRRLLETMREVSLGGPLERAFAARVGVPLAEAKRAYTAFLDATRGAWAQRSAGTLLAP